MAAGLGFKTFTTGEVLSASDVNGYLMQGVLVFASAAARNAAITSPQEGQFAYTKDTNGLWYYDGAAWVASGATGDIEGVTAGTGISGGGTSGTVTITNSMATAIDAKGDLIAGTGADAFSRVAVGSNNQVLTADSSTATGIKWASVSAGGMTLLASGSLSGTTTTISSISASYNNLVLMVDSYWESGSTATPTPGLRFNSDTGTNYYNFTATVNGANFDRQSSQFLVATNGSASYGFSQVEIFDYASTAHWKVGRVISASSTHVGGAAINANLLNLVWNNTSAIDTITFGAPSSGWSGGNYKLYGVK